VRAGPAAAGVEWTTPAMTTTALNSERRGIPKSAEFRTARNSEER
jgi:hypothetical protein